MPPLPAATNVATSSKRRANTPRRRHGSAQRPASSSSTTSRPGPSTAAEPRGKLGAADHSTDELQQVHSANETLRKHISKQHQLLVEQQDALQEERRRHMLATLDMRSLSTEVSLLKEQLAAAEKERALQHRHLILLERAVAAGANTFAKHVAATVVAPESGPAEKASTMGKRVGAQSASTVLREVHAVERGANGRVCSSTEAMGRAREAAAGIHDNASSGDAHGSREGNDAGGTRDQQQRQMHDVAGTDNGSRPIVPHVRMARSLTIPPTLVDWEALASSYNNPLV